jgi:hydroxypyruvate isomerase
MTLAASDELRLAANLKWLFNELPFEERFAAVAAAGFTAVELPAPYDRTPAQLRTLLADNGLQAVLLNTPQGEPGSPTAGGAACLPDHVADFEAGVLRGLEYAGELEAGILHVVAGRRPAGVHRDVAFAQYVRNIAWAAEQARRTGVQLVLEMQNQRSAPGFVLESQAMTAAVVAAVGGPVGVLFDVFHTQVAEGDVVRTFDSVAPLVTHVQIGDGPDRSEPGTGELAWPFVIEHIRQSGYTGWFGCEFTPVGDSSGVPARLGEVL